ncbi:hypothetical protein CANCADRAFT_30513 [Tortispora caseinolytica NRRL Y-17796]|uniref:Enoyl-CoA hydratase n=1 Tax=Tortispora caseinolytica NRRL Y-17796 TaxID=767744 RepID=A0A1E4TKR5_9ASCO|nr:hypothetical protein CANCADRAFT_30513 [Tortispora caseinolytica NRRL Y-17796]
MPALPRIKPVYRTGVRSLSTIIKTEVPTASNGTITVLKFNRPEAKNAISLKLNDELRECVLDVATGRTNPQALILASNVPKIFCAGADLKERRSFTPADTAAFLQQLNSTLDILEDLEIPTLTAIDGLALGGGLEIALATDFRVLSTTSAVGLPETKLAILPGAGGTKRLPKVVGHTRALEAVLTGRRIPAEEALQWGLATAVADDSLQKAIEIAQNICEGGPIGVRAAKKAVVGGTGAWAEAMYQRVLPTKDRIEALVAFAEKRKPNFKGE